MHPKARKIIALWVSVIGITVSSLAMWGPWAAVFAFSAAWGICWLNGDA